MDLRNSMKFFLISTLFVVGCTYCKAAETGPLSPYEANEATAQIPTSNTSPLPPELVETTQSSAQPSITLRPQVVRDKAAVEEATKALRSAVEANDSVAAQAAIDKGADIERVDWWGWTPLHKAAWEGYVQVIDVLIRAGANLEAQTSGRNRPLHLAAWQGKNGAVTRLVQAGAKLYPIGSMYQTPLGKADHYSHDSTVELLRSLGARM